MASNKKTPLAHTSAAVFLYISLKRILITEN
nr:MAG TPA: hypothetical protein [Caudoviricetes sp.]